MPAKKKCTKCGKSKDAEKGFYKGRYSWCKTCFTAYVVARRKADPRLTTAHLEQNRRQHRFSKYRLREKDYQALKRKQRNRCAICRQALIGKRAPNIDHDHKTGKVRGLLCHSCNYGLGFFRDSTVLLKVAISYLSLM